VQNVEDDEQRRRYCVGLKALRLQNIYMPIEARKKGIADISTMFEVDPMQGCELSNWCVVVGVNPTRTTWILVGDRQPLKYGFKMVETACVPACLVRQFCDLHHHAVPEEPDDCIEVMPPCCVVPAQTLGPSERDLDYPLDHDAHGFFFKQRLRSLA
jgi:hypothetical protein